MFGMFESSFSLRTTAICRLEDGLRVAGRSVVIVRGGISHTDACAKSRGEMSETGAFVNVFP
jgi:hypothetical protein